MMTHKVVIANCKQAQNGKSTSIRYVFEILSKRYPYRVIEPMTGYDPAQDVEAIIDIPQPNGQIVKVGIESMGDPGYARPHKSIVDFLNADCEIILVACRIKGKTIDEVRKLRSSQWQVIWFGNSTMTISPRNVIDASGSKLFKQDEQLQDQLSRDYGFYVASLIERLVLTGGVI